MHPPPLCYVIKLCSRLWIWWRMDGQTDTQRIDTSNIQTQTDGIRRHDHARKLNVSYNKKIAFAISLVWLLNYLAWEREAGELCVDKRTARINLQVFCITFDLFSLVKGGPRSRTNTHTEYVRNRPAWSILFRRTPKGVNHMHFFVVILRSYLDVGCWCLGPLC